MPELRFSGIHLKCTNRSSNLQENVGLPVLKLFYIHLITLCLLYSTALSGLLRSFSVLQTQELHIYYDHKCANG